LVKDKKTLDVIAETLGKSPEAVRKKIERLKLEVVDQALQQRTTTSNKLPSVEEEKQLRKMVEAGCNAYEIAVELKRQPNAVYEKAKRLGLKVIISRKTRKIITTNSLQLPEEAMRQKIRHLRLEVVE
jgi:Fe-S cluster assembly iron-binding protein IscA